MAFAACYFMLPANNPLHWVIYLFPLVPIIFGKDVSTKQSQNFAIIAIASYVVSFFLSAFSWANEGSPSIKFISRDAAVFIVVLSGFYASVRWTPRNISILGLGLIFLVVYYGLTDATVDTISVVDSQSPFESVFAITFGAMSLFALYYRRRALGLLFFIAMVICFKRSSWGAFVVSLGLLWLDMQVQRSLPRMVDKFRTSITVALIIVMAFMSLRIMDFFWYIRDNFLPDKPIWEVTLGRSAIYNVTDSVLDRSTFAQYIFGHGPGYIKLVLEQTVRLGLPHNEIRHALLDYGLIGLVLYLVLLLAASKRAGHSSVLVWYILLVGFIDNFVFVYISAIPVILLIGGRWGGAESRR